MGSPMRFLALSACLLLGACAHPITINPKADFSPAGSPVQKSVAYLVEEADRAREVTTPGGGGDMISYFPYRDLEPGIFQVLSAIFSKVTLIRKLDDERIATNAVQMVFVPKITTSSSSSGVFTWPPTQFSVTIDYKVRDAAGRQTYSNTLVGNGGATFDEFMAAKDFALAARRASEDALNRFGEQVRAAPELR